MPLFQSDNIYADLDEKAGKTTNWENVLLQQIILINRLMTEENEMAFISAVEALKISLTFFTKKDKEFNETIRELELQARQWRDAGKDSNGNPVAEGQILYANAKKTYEALMNAMGHAGFYPQRKVDFRE